MSQDRHEIYITVADYDQNYVKYLENELTEAEDPGFMTMHQYGPWDIRNLEDMQEVAQYLVAIFIRAESVVR